MTEGMSTAKKAGIGAGLVAVLGVVASVVGIGNDVKTFLNPADNGPGPGPVINVQSQPAAQKQAFGTVQVPNGLVTLYAWSAPSMQSTPQASLPANTRLQIRCTVQGQTVSNGTTQSSLWDYTDSGYVPDSYLYTGSDQAQMPTC